MLLIYFYQIKQKDNALLKLQAQNLEVKNEELEVLREKENELAEREQQHLRSLMQSRERELSTITLQTHEKNSLLSELVHQLTELRARTENPERKSEVDQIRRLVKENLEQSDTWEQFVFRFERVHPNFFQRIQEQHPDLTPNDTRLCAYLMIGFDNKEIAQVSGIAHASVKKNINRLKKRIGLPAESDLREYVSGFSV
ncbi:MAG: hypothetical protein AAF740_13425 [Bacteroidota bacterium]